jgi:hypothetical protein
LPSPKDVDVEKRFKTYALATGKDSSEGDINDLVKSWLAAERTTGNESNLNTTVIEWSKTDLKRIIELANQQWEKLKQDLAMQNSQANHFATAMGGESFDGKIQNLLSALRDVVFPRVGSRKALRRKLKTLIEDIADSGSSIQMLLPIMPLLDSSLDIEAEMRLGLASHDRHVYVTTLQGLLFWAKSVSRQDESSNDTSLSELPIDLMRELGVTLANRRQPHLDQAMAAVKVYLRSSNKPLDQQFLDSLNHGLHYLQAELEYRFWDDGNSQFEYDEIPNLRFKTVQIAVCMKRDRGVASNAVGNWIESAKSDSLPEIRRLVEEVPM